MGTGRGLIPLWPAPGPQSRISSGWTEIWSPSRETSHTSENPASLAAPPVTPTHTVVSTRPRPEGCQSKRWRRAAARPATATSRTPSDRLSRRNGARRNWPSSQSSKVSPGESASRRIRASIVSVVSWSSSVALHPGGATHVGGTAPVGPPGCLSSAPSASAWARTPSRDGPAVPATTARSGGPGHRPPPSSRSRRLRCRRRGRRRLDVRRRHRPARRAPRHDPGARTTSRRTTPEPARPTAFRGGASAVTAEGAARQRSAATGRRAGPPRDGTGRPPAGSSRRLRRPGSGGGLRARAAHHRPARRGRGTPAVHATRGRPPGAPPAP